MPNPMTTPPRMTAVFEYDLKSHPGNPFHTDTPFGRPLVLELGDFSEADCEAVAEDRGTAMTANPFADLCADPALLAEAVEVLEEILSVDPFEAPLAAANAEQRAADLITALLALLARIAAQEAQIKGLRQAMTDADNDVILAHEARKDAETALAAERAKVAKLVEAGKALGLREIVAGWNGEGKEKPYTPHPAHLRATIKTTCGAVYALDTAITEASQ